MSTETLVLTAVLTALVIILQFMGAFIKLGPFSISLVLIPIVIGAATCGIGASTWLGLVFGTVVLASGDASAFLAIDIAGTVITVLLKGMACGALAGIAYKALFMLLGKRSERQIAKIKAESGLCEACEPGVFSFISRNNRYVAVLVAAIVCPLVNTGVFLLGCTVFFMDTVTAWAEAAGVGGDVAYYMFFVLVGGNFLFELGMNIILSPIIVRILRIRKKVSK
jgi:hypothetical protein